MEKDLILWTRQIERFVTSRLGDPLIAEEVVQEAVLRLLLQHRLGRPVQRPRAWLFRTARNLAVDVVRRRLPSPLGIEALGRIPDPLSLDEDAALDTGAGETERREVLAWLPELLADLPARDRDVLRARYEEGSSCRELAARSGITVDNAKVRLHRARRRLRRAIETRVRAQDGLR